MVDLNRDICQRGDCTVRACFNFEGKKRGQFCKKHIDPGMINVVDKKREPISEIPLDDDAKSCDCPKKYRVFNFKGQEGAFCGKHKKEGMANLSKDVCQFEECPVQAVFNVEHQTTGAFCYEHKDPNMFNVKSKKCQFVGGCRVEATFNLPGLKTPLYCAKHQDPGMICITVKRCQFPGGCGVIPTFNYRGEVTTMFCVKHKTKDMFDVKHPLCQDGTCDRRPTFNIEGESRGRYCLEHKDPGMVDVENSLCEFPGCPIHPSYNFEHEVSARFCVSHKDDGMISVTQNFCEVDGCNVGASYNFEDESKGRFCVTHKSDDMINVVSKLCEFLGCPKHARFNHESEIGYKFCGEHKDPGMTDLSKIYCEVCGTRANFNLPGLKAIRCAKDKLEGMIFNPRKKCYKEKCKGFAQFGIIIPLHCEIHKATDEEDLCLRICKQCKSLEKCNSDGLCFEYCINSEFFKRFKHKKELRVKTLLENEIKQPMFSYDKSIDKACTKKRPDFCYDAGTHFVIVEVDENMHRNYVCEERRMIEITQSAWMPCIFIRYNPDSFVDIAGRKSTIPNSKREQVLIDWVKHSLTTPPTNETEFIRVLYLFYNGHNESKVGFEVLSI